MAKPNYIEDVTTLLGTHVRDCTTGIAGRIVTVSFFERDEAQFQLRRYGLDGNGHPFPLHWVHARDTSPSTEEDARG